MPGIFIAGTDTDAGKTIATLLLAHGLIERKVTARPYKPIQSGAEWKDGEWKAPDTEMYHLLPETRGERLYTYLFKKASSPHLAAEEEAAIIDEQVIIEEIRRRASKSTLLLVEGAGGLYVPLNRKGRCMVDVMEETGLPVVIAARAGLGTINHTILTIEAIQKRGLPITGVVFSSTVPGEKSIERDNFRVIHELSGLPIIGHIPFIKDIDHSLRESRYRSEIVRDWKFDRLMEGINSEYKTFI
ncbi:dethiobiotin synthase [Bacillus sp. PK3_68]|uniref:dethiobiotin synthase n=1 Tax=Bacillus sp. PK3_68 TaxID=2027408 RepID=UPI000E7537B6|nr:dethiobiotin synthase [Bacillus sp. PK3_68]RJS61534.1 dethiobiotin synthase [Bacillus sp. PK3_68]